MMPTVEKTPAEIELEAAIQSRVSWLKSVVEFVCKLTREQGRQIYYDQGNSNTHTVDALDNFESFSFLTDLGQSMMGGNDVKIWYHPDGPQRPLTRHEQLPPVFHLRSMTLWPNADDKLEVFDVSPAWREALQQLMDSANAIIKKREQDQQDQQKRREQQAEEAKRMAKLQGQASRLKL